MTVTGADLFSVFALGCRSSSSGSRRISFFDSNAVSPQEIKVAAELRAENRIRIELGISSRCSSRGLYLVPPFFKIRFGKQNIDAPFSDAQPYLITSPNEPQRTPYR
jgi:hypothetical protein